MLAMSFRLLSPRLSALLALIYLSLQGTLFYTVFKGDKIAETLNQLGFGAFSRPHSHSPARLVAAAD